MSSQQRIIHTIDEKHTTMLDQFHKDSVETIPALQKEKETLKEDIRKLDPTNVDKIIEYKDKIKAIQQDINRIKMEKKKYYLDNSKYIFDYFEQKKDINNIEKPSQHDEVIQSFFKIK